jgi:hypothetical protein
LVTVATIASLHFESVSVNTRKAVKDSPRPCLSFRSLAVSAFFIMAAARGGRSKSDQPEVEAPAEVDVTATFEGMGLKQNLLRGIFEFGYEKPTAIQQRAIVPMTSGRDVIAQAQSGTGKTSMLSIAALQVVNVQSRDVQVLCLNPTRELAVQVIPLQTILNPSLIFSRRRPKP